MSGKKRFGTTPIELSILDDDDIVCLLSLKPGSLTVTGRGENHSYRVSIKDVLAWAREKGKRVPIREKRREVRNVRRRPKFDITAGQTTFPNLSKRHLILRLVSEAIKAGKTPDDIRKAVAKADAKKLFEILDGELTEKEEVARALKLKKQNPRRYFHEKSEFFRFNGNTYVLTNQWGTTTLPAAQTLRDAFPDLEITIDEH